MRGPLPSGNYHINVFAEQMPVQGTVHADLIARANGTDTPVGGIDMQLMPTTGKISFFDYSAQAMGDFSATALSLKCGDKLVLRLTLLPGSNKATLWPLIDLP